MYPAKTCAASSSKVNISCTEAFAGILLIVHDPMILITVTPCSGTMIGIPDVLVVGCITSPHTYVFYNVNGQYVSNQSDLISPITGSVIVTVPPGNKIVNWSSYTPATAVSADAH